MNEIVKTINSPDSLLDDTDSKAFYVLRDETIALCKTHNELPYHKNRSTYLSAGRFSPKYKKVVFWPESINTNRAFTLLVENNHIDSSYEQLMSGQTTSLKGKVKQKDALKSNRHTSVRKAEIENLEKAGMKNQKSLNDNSKENKL